MRSKFMSWLLILTLVITMLPMTTAPVAAAGTSYDGVQWSISGGVLTISKGNATTEFAAGEMGDNIESYECWRTRSSSITKVIIEDGVTKIGSRAFDSMSALTEVEIAGTVKSIGDQAFNYCPKLETVTINEGVESIGAMAFNACTALANITFPTSVKSVGKNVLTGTAYYDFRGDMVICGNVLVGTKNADGYDESDPCYIPEGVVCIADSAFSGIDISVMEFPESLLYIGNYAFEGDGPSVSDKTVKGIDFKNVVHIGNGSFRYLHNITDIDLSGVRYIGNNAFYGCNALKTVKLANDMEYVGDSAFLTSDSITSLNVPEYVTEIYGSSFSTKGSLDKVTYADPDGDGFIYVNGMLIKVNTTANGTDYSSVTIADGTYTIAHQAFDYMHSADAEQMKTLHIPESVECIGSSNNFMHVTDVYYAGSLNGWESIKKSNMSYFPNATIHCAKASAVLLEDCTVTLEYTEKVYTGSALTPGVTVKAPNGKQLKLGTDYTVSYSDNTSVGTAKVTIVGQGEYTGKATATFEITKEANNGITAKLSYTKTTHDGGQKTPTVTVTTASGKTLEEGKDYNVEFKETSRRNVGIYKVSVVLGGTNNNYSGTIPLEFAIVPKATTFVVTRLSTASNGYDNISATWESVTDASGYYVYYKKASSSTWSNAIDCGTKLKYTTGNLSDGVKYDVKVTAYYKSGDDVYTAIDSSQKSIYTLKQLTNVKVKKSAKTKVKVSWKNISGETGYQIQKMKKKGKKYVSVKSVTKAAKYSSVVISHAKGKKFYYRVRPYKTEKISGISKKVYGPWTKVKGIKL